MPAELVGKAAEVREQACGEAEFGAEMRDGVNPSIWVGPQAQQDGDNIGMKGHEVVGAQHTSGVVEQDKVLGCSQVQDTAS